MSYVLFVLDRTPKYSGTYECYSLTLYSLCKLSHTPYRLSASFSVITDIKPVPRMLTNLDHDRHWFNRGTSLSVHDSFGTYTFGACFFGTASIGALNVNIGTVQFGT